MAEIIVAAGYQEKLDFESSATLLGAIIRHIPRSFHSSTLHHRQLHPSTTNPSPAMKRRSFVKKSVAAAIVAATPLALTGLVNAAGGGGGTNTETGTGIEPDTTGWFDTTAYFTTSDEDLLEQCGIYAATHMNSARKFRYTRLVGSVMHLFCYTEWRCPVVEDGVQKNMYCRMADQQTGALEIDCGVYVVDDDGNAPCRVVYSQLKKPGQPWP